MDGQAGLAVKTDVGSEQVSSSVTAAVSCTLRADAPVSHKQVVRQEQEEQAAASKGRKTTSVADAREVARVRAARSDYDCLQARCSA